MQADTSPGPVLETGPPDQLHLSIPGREEAVREGLRLLFSTLLLRDLPAEDRGTAEIVLAEALNNIVEHAYAQDGGQIEITLQMRRDGLAFTIIDTGSPMPGGALPEGRLLPLGELADLPEGGFGWHLIRTLSSDLTYCREGGRNTLSFRIAPEPAAAPVAANAPALAERG